MDKQTNLLNFMRDFIEALKDPLSQNSIAIFLQLVDGGTT